MLFIINHPHFSCLFGSTNLVRCSSPHVGKMAAALPVIVAKLQGGRKYKNELPLWEAFFCFSLERDSLSSMLPLTKLENISAITVSGFNQSWLGS